MGITTAAVLALLAKYPPVEGWQNRAEVHPVFAELDPRVETSFAAADRNDPARYADLFSYFLTGFVAYRSDAGSAAYYPGDPSIHGRSIDGLEGFSRIAPLLAAWLSSGRDRVIVLPQFGEADLFQLLATGIENGTNPASAGYWGNYNSTDQQYVEAADIALALWLTRDKLWAGMSADAQKRVADWLMQSQRGSTDWRFNNWRLYGLLVNRVLKDLGQPVDDAAFKTGWNRLLATHAGDGWFSDDPDGDFDYYNAWSFHYAFYWLIRIDPALDTPDMGALRRSFVRFYRHLITPAGIPITGRSVCYRAAASVPLIVSVAADDGVVPPGEARRALDTTWRYFVERGALANGAITQGYCGADRRVMEPYSGPASCLWSIRSLVLAFSLPANAPFWQAQPSPLKIEQGDFSLTNATTGWRVKGDAAELAVVIEKPQYSDSPPLKPHTSLHRAASWLLRRPFGLGNRRAQYERARYASNEPFTGCVRDDKQVLPE